MRYLKISIALILIALINGCNFDVVNHDEIKAGNIAANFLEQILLKGDSNASYEFLHSSLKKQLNKEKFSSLVVQLKEGLKAKSFEAVGFELLDAPDNLAIYFRITSPVEGERFMLITMYSKTPPDYKVVHIKTIDVLPKLNGAMSGTYKSANIQIKKGA